MFARVTTFEGDPERMEEAARLFSDEVIPWLRDATGFRGWIVLLDREKRQSLGITFWASEAAMKDDQTSGGAIRDELAASMQTTMTNLDYYELVVAEALALDRPDE